MNGNFLLTTSSLFGASHISITLQDEYVPENIRVEIPHLSQSDTLG